MPAAEPAESSKRIKCTGLGSGFSFYPVAIETLGAWGKDMEGLVSELEGRLAALTGDPKSLTLLLLRFGIAMQRGNTTGIPGTQPQTGRPVAGRGGPGVRTPPEPFRVTFPNRVNPVSFFTGGG